MPFASYIQTIAELFSEFTTNLLLDCAKYFYDSVIMQQKERKALDRCFDDLLKDLYPSPGFLHSLLAEEILTEEQMDKIANANSRETQVHLLLRYLPSRGPRAFTVFTDKLNKDYPWLSDKLREEKAKQQTGQEKLNKQLLTVIQHKLMPLVNTDSNIDEVDGENTHPSTIIHKFGELICSLESKCHKALESKPHEKAPIHKLIEEKIDEERSKLERLEKFQNKHVEEKLLDLRKENRDLKKQLKEIDKLKKENKKLTETLEKQREKLKEQAKMSKELKKRSNEVEKLKKQTEVLQSENDMLREQMRGNVCDMFA